MVNDNTNSLNQIEQNFKELIIERCKFCGFDRYLEENPDFKFPKITEDLLGPYTQCFISIPGMFGGFAYYLEETNGKPVLYAEQSSRMDHSDDDYLYFEITLDNSRPLQGEERKTIAKKFRELGKKATEEHAMKLKEIRSNHEPSK